MTACSSLNLSCIRPNASRTVYRFLVVCNYLYRATVRDVESACKCRSYFYFSVQK